jgi:hypothetical protein
MRGRKILSAAKNITLPHSKLKMEIVESFIVSQRPAGSLENISTFFSVFRKREALHLPRAGQCGILCKCESFDKITYCRYREPECLALACQEKHREEWLRRRPGRPWSPQRSRQPSSPSGTNLTRLIKGLGVGGIEAYARGPARGAPLILGCEPVGCTHQEWLYEYFGSKPDSIIRGTSR